MRYWDIVEKTEKILNGTLEEERTHLFDLMRVIIKNSKDEIKVLKLNYLAEGIYAEVEDLQDNQIYTIVMKKKE